jgi:hypothetical protein
VGPGKQLATAGLACVLASACLTPPGSSGGETDGGPGAAVDGGGDGSGNPVGDGPHQCDSDTLALYHFDGSLTNACGTDLSLLAYGSPSTVEVESMSSFGTARRFMGETSRLAAMHAPPLADSRFTAEAWIRPSQLPPDGQLASVLAVDDFPSGEFQWRMAITSTGKLAVATAQASCMHVAAELESVRSVTVGEWHQVVFTYEDESKRHTVRVNGEAWLDAKPVVASSFCQSPYMTFLTVGNGGAGQQPFRGDIDEVRYSRVIR